MKTLHLSIIGSVGIVIVGVALMFLIQTASPAKNTDVSYWYAVFDKYEGVEQDSGIITIRNQSYYMTTAPIKFGEYINESTIQFHNVTFSFTKGSGYTPGGYILESYVKFPDDPVQYGAALRESSLPGAQNHDPTTILSVHTKPQAGLTRYHDQIKLLASADVNPSDSTNKHFS